jgi:hypothetical protein
MGDWYTWLTHLLCKQEQTVRIRYPPPTKGAVMKPRNHVFLALRKRNGAGAHKKTAKQLRGKWKRDMGL